MIDREKVIKHIVDCINAVDGLTNIQWVLVELDILNDALVLLKAQEPTMVEPKRIELADETKAWLDEMDAVDALGNIADICIDWDGYRTADGLGGLINEIWAYARYCADRLEKAQEPKPVYVTAEINHRKIGNCPNCGKPINSGDYPNYCGQCGQAVKWE